MRDLENKSILITGGTGSLGNSLIDIALELGARRIAIFSRDELKQSEMRIRFKNDERLRWFLGDIRDLARLERAMHGVDYVIHAAALKQVDTGEYNPMEFIKTNVLGSQNVIEASINAGVQKVVALSTDKASSPINLYGATKLTADKLFVAANNYSIPYGSSFSVVRYGNVMASRGSVIPYFIELGKKNKPIPITDFRMTRFWISLQAASEFVLKSLVRMNGGELFVPKIPSMRILDLATALAPGSEVHETGIRPGEKLHEEMISADDARRTTALSDFFVVNPVHAEWGYVEHLGPAFAENSAYRSDSNTEWISVEEIRRQFIENEN